MLAAYLLAAVTSVWTVRNDPFFWDTIQLASKHAHFFYGNGLHWQALPLDIDSGHPPLLGYYLACIWTFFGKNLQASHCAMLPFIIISILMLWRIGHRIGGGKWGTYFPLLVFADPVFLTQGLLVGPDIILASGLLIALEGVLGKRPWLLAGGVTLLALVSMRGMMTAAAFGIWLAGKNLYESRSFSGALRTMLPFLPGAILAAAFLAWHQQVCGWTGFHTQSPWAGAFERSGLNGMVRSFAVYVWRWLDLGRVGELALFGYLLFKLSIRKIAGLEHGLLFLLICLVATSMYTAVSYANLSAHRYLLPAFMAFHLLLFQMTASSDLSISIKRFLFAAVVIVLISGHAWVYPRGIAMDWDCTLAHRSYHTLRAEAIRFLAQNQISIEQTGTDFPNINSMEMVQLDGNSASFVPRTDSVQWILCSNVFNDISESDFNKYETEWRLRWESRRGFVWMAIYEQK